MSDQLTTLSGQQSSPHKAEGEDFKVSGKKGDVEASGKDTLVDANSSPTLARGEDFKVDKADGESGTAVGSNVYVCLESGEHESYLPKDSHMTEQTGV
jgi:hypothetical protein